MKKILKVLILFLGAGLIVIQFFRIDTINPPFIEAETLESAVTVPNGIKLLIKRSCNDCHTNMTVYPWYSNIQPMAWLMHNHIEDGRRNLNFSVFATYTLKKQSRKLEQICEQVESGEMPLPSYLWIHRSSIVSADESKTICDWAKVEREKIDARISLNSE